MSGLELRALREVLGGRARQLPATTKAHGLALRALREVLDADDPMATFADGPPVDLDHPNANAPRRAIWGDFARVARGSDDLARQTRIWESIRHEVRCQHSAPESADLFREVMAICDDQISKGDLSLLQI